MIIDIKHKQTDMHNQNDCFCVLYKAFHSYCNLFIFVHYVQCKDLNKNPKNCMYLSIMGLRSSICNMKRISMRCQLMDFMSLSFIVIFDCCYWWLYFINLMMLFNDIHKYNHSNFNFNFNYHYNYINYNCYNYI